ncbi:MAG: hypothetical protein U1E53_06325 [Dongiaceae bacterium]
MTSTAAPETGTQHPATTEGGRAAPATFHVSSFNVSGTSNEVVVFANEVEPSWGAAGEAQAPVLQTRVLLRMSPQSAKDLAEILHSFVARYEETYGELQTDYLRRRGEQG